MVEWMSLAEITKDGQVFDRLMHALLGLYMWEWAISLDFDFQFFTGKRRMRWPLYFYFAGRYSLLFAMVGIAIALNVTTQVDCQALYTFNQLFGNAAIGLASVNLSLRTMALWQMNRYVVVPLVALIMGQWSLLLHGILLTAQWIPGQGCVIVGTANKTLAASFVYTMGFDAVVLALTAYRLSRDGPVGTRSRLIGMIFSDGLIYFLIAFLANAIATVFMLLDLNPVMSIIFNVPSAIASTIVASRAVRRLSNFLSPEPERFNGANSSLAFRAGNAVNSLFKRRAPGAPDSGFGGGRRGPAQTVSVPLDTFSQARSATDVASSVGKGPAGSDLDLEAAYPVASQLASPISPMGDKESHAF